MIKFAWSIRNILKISFWKKNVFRKKKRWLYFWKSFHTFWAGYSWIYAFRKEEMREKLPSDLEKKQSNVVEIEEWYSDQLYKRRTFPHTNDRVMLDPLRNSGSHYISSEYFIQICIFWSENFTAEREKQWGIFQKKGTLKEKIHDSVCLPD